MKPQEPTLDLLDIIAEFQYKQMLKNDGSIPEKHFAEFVANLVKDKKKVIKSLKQLMEIELRMKGIEIVKGNIQ